MRGTIGHAAGEREKDQETTDRIKFDEDQIKTKQEDCTRKHEVDWRGDQLRRQC